MGSFIDNDLDLKKYTAGLGRLAYIVLGSKVKITSCVASKVIKHGTTCAYENIKARKYCMPKHKITVMLNLGISHAGAFTKIFICLVKS